MKKEYSELCYDCGKVFYSKKIDSKKPITLYVGICPRCKKEKTLIPIADWENRGD